MKKCLSLLAASAIALPALAQEAPPPDGQAAPPQGPKPSMFLVGVAKAAAVDHNPVRTFSGRVLSPETVAIVPQVAGEIVEVCFEEGALLQKGDPMYRIDPVKYEAAVASAKASVAQAEANLAYLSKSHDRTLSLREKNVASDDDLDSAVAARDAAQATLAAAQAALATAQDNLDHCSIAAPVSGKVGLNAAPAGNYVSTASGPLATIVRQDPVRVSFAIGSRDYLSVFGAETGLRTLFDVRLRLADGSPYLQDGAVEFVGNAVNPSTDTMPVYAGFPNPDGLLVPGATVKVEVQARNPAKLVSIPLTALLHDGDQAYVWMVGDHNLPVRRDVVAGPATATYQTILEGLAEGEEVIARGTHKVIPNVPVEPVKL